MSNFVTDPGRSESHRMFPIPFRLGICHVALYFLFAVYLTWPLARFAASSLPIGTEPAATVPLLNLWTFMWNVHQLNHPGGSYWDAGLFLPERGTFALSEMQPLSFLLAPFFWWGGTPSLAYNALLIFYLTCNGISAHRTLRWIGLSPVVTVVGALLVQSLPLVHWQLGVIQLVPLFGIMETWVASDQFTRKPGFGSAFRVSAWFTVSCLMCVNCGLFALPLMMGAGVVFLPQLLSSLRTSEGSKKVLWAMLGCAVPAAILLMFLLPQQAIIRGHDFRRSEDLIRDLSLHPGDFTVTPWSEWIPGDLADPTRRPYWKCGVGWCRLAVAVLGLCFGLSVRRYRTWSLFLLITGFLAFLFAQGTLWKVTSVSPYQLLVNVFPGFSQVRNVFRFAFFTQLSVLLLAGLGLEFLFATINRWFQTHGEIDADQGASGRRHWGLTLSTGLRLSIAFLLCFEVIPESQRLYQLVDQERNRNWIDWLQRNTRPEVIVAFLPFPESNGVTFYEETALQMYLATFHQRRLVNGYSGFFPESYLQALAAASQFPRDSCLDRFQERGVQFCIVRRTQFPPEYVAQWSHPTRLLRVFADEQAGVDIYHLYPPSDHQLHAILPVRPEGIGSVFIGISPLWFLICSAGLSASLRAFAHRRGCLRNRIA